MAGLVLFLASKAGAFVSGAVIPLDGGFLLGQGGSKL
jgi:NAD(P)-dependent dehydrogenase (short-subunit alcohol dehydrogenase family)